MSSEVRAGGARGDTPAVRRWASAVGRGAWEFLVGDTPELFVGAALAVAVVALLTHHGAARAVTVAAMPVLVVALLGASVWRARNAGRRQP